MKIGIIGAGMSGLALAQRLSRVTPSPYSSRPPSPVVWPPTRITVPSSSIVFITSFFRPIDTCCHSLEISGWASKLSWRNDPDRVFRDRSIHSVSNAIRILKFPPLSLWTKCRLAITILYCSRINNWQTTGKNHCRRLARQALPGRATYEKMWKPLLLAKLGENLPRVSAVFIWTYIKRMFSARDKSASEEQMGHVRGGYKTVFDRLSALHPKSAGAESPRLDGNGSARRPGTGGGHRESTQTEDARRLTRSSSPGR